MTLSFLNLGFKLSNTQGGRGSAVFGQAKIYPKKIHQAHICLFTTNAMFLRVFATWTVDIKNEVHLWLLVQRFNRPKTLSTLNHSTPLVKGRSFIKLWNLGQPSVRFCLVRGDKYIEQLWHIHATTLTNPCINFYKSMYQFLHIHVTTNTPNNFDKSNIFGKI